ncbi:TPA: restriction endonuclease subunit S [Vibrio parahaemolyticus]|nr:restriction endonuclease subunit S [Vibrio parahaemolyticus]
MVPNGWENKTLETLCEPTAPITYGVLKPGDYVDGGTPLLQIKDLLNDLSDIDSLHRISHELDLEYRRSRIATNDILISLVGTVGRIGLVPEELNGANIHRNLGRIRTKNYEFLVHYLNSDIAKNKIGLSSSGSSQSALNLSVLKALKVPVPPLPEQRKIAQILSTWDRGIATTEKLIDASKQQKKALMQQLLTGKKRLIDPETGKAFEGEWEEVKLKAITQFIKDGTHGTHKRYDKGVPMLSAANITKNHKVNFDGAPNISHDDYNKIHSKYEINEGDILLTVVGTLGRVALVPKAMKFTLQRSVAIIRTSNKASNQFLMQVFSSKEFNNLLMSKSNSTAQAGVYLGELAKIKLLLPSLEEQQKIASILAAADKDIELLEAKLAHLKQEKKALMQQLLTGKRRVKVAETEAA